MRSRARCAACASASSPRDGQDAADATVPQWEIETVADAAALPPPETEARPIMAAPGTDTDAREDNPDDNGQEGAMPKTEAELAAESDALDERKTIARCPARRRSSRAQTAALAAREAETGRSAIASPPPRRRSNRTSKPAASCLPRKPGSPRCSLRCRTATTLTLTFAAADGGAQVSEAPRAVFDRLLAALPSRVDYATRAGGAGAGKPLADDAQAHRRRGPRAAGFRGREGHRPLRRRGRRSRDRQARSADRR